MQGFSVTVENVVTKAVTFLSLKKLHTSSEMLSFLPRWDYCRKCKFDTDVKIENYYHHDGKQLGFYKKRTYQNTEPKEECSCDLYIARNEEFHFIIWQKLYSREHQMPYSTWRKLT